MISFSKITKDTFENMAKADFVVDRIYFVEGLGTFITDTTAELGYKKYDYDFSTEFAGKVDKAPGGSGTIFTNDGNGGLVSSLYKVGVTSKTDFGADNKLATEKGVESFVNDAINTAANGAISGIAFSNETAQISYTPIAGSSTAVVATLSGLVRNFTYADGKITLTASNGFEKTINLPAEQFLKDVKTYTVPSAGVTADVTGVFTEAIPANTFTGISGIPGLVFKFAVIDDPTDETSGGVERYRYTFVSVEDLVHDFNEDQFELVNGKLTLKSIPHELISGYTDYTFTGEATGPVTIAIGGTAHDVTITGDLLKNENEFQLDANGKLEIKEVPSGKVATLPISKIDGLDDAINGLIPKVSGQTDKVAKFDANGNVVSTGKTVGTELSGAIASPTANTLATEAAVNGFIIDCLSFK